MLARWPIRSWAPASDGDCGEAEHDKGGGGGFGGGHCADMSEAVVDSEGGCAGPGCEVMTAAATAAVAAAGPITDEEWLEKVGHRFPEMVGEA